jgi:hypothetical protein
MDAVGLRHADVIIPIGHRWHGDDRWRVIVLTDNAVRDDRCSECRTRSLDKRAYSYLLGLYLGDGCFRNRTLSICCCDDYPGLMDDAERSLKSVLPFASTARWQQKGCTEVASFSRHWACLFPQSGPGRKHLRPIELAAWQRKIVEEFPRDFIRGLIHSDGCRSEYVVTKTVRGELKSYQYTRYWFSNLSNDIHALYQWALDLVGVEWTRTSDKHTSVAKKASVALMDTFVGPKF